MLVFFHGFFVEPARDCFGLWSIQICVTSWDSSSLVAIKETKIKRGKGGNGDTWVSVLSKVEMQGRLCPQALPFLNLLQWLLSLSFLAWLWLDEKLRLGLKFLRLKLEPLAKRAKGKKRWNPAFWSMWSSQGVAPYYCSIAVCASSSLGLHFEWSGHAYQATTFPSYRQSSVVWFSLGLHFEWTVTPWSKVFGHLSKH